MERLFDLTNAELKGELDDLMSVQESVNPVLFSKYVSARAIDNIMGGGGTDGFNINTFTIPGGGSILFPTGAGPIPGAMEIYIRAVQGNMFICTTNLPASPCVSGYEALKGITYKGLIQDLGLDLNRTNLQVTNPGIEDAILRIGLKQD
jgi:hypothetical protein